MEREGNSVLPGLVTLLELEIWLVLPRSPLQPTISEIEYFFAFSFMYI